MKHLVMTFKKNRLPISTVINFFHLSSIQVSNAVLQILLFPIIIRIVGLSNFGNVMVANSFAGLMGIVINYGTNQSGIKDIALCHNDPKLLSEKFFPVFYIRLLLFLVSIIILPLLRWFHIPNFEYFVFASLLVFAEILNPIFFYIGIEKLLVFNIANMFSKILSICMILFLIKGPADSYLVNFYLGLSNVIIFIVLYIYAIKHYKLVFHLPKTTALWNFMKANFFLVGNNISVHLQQSIFLFGLASTGHSIVLGAYAICDKIIWAFRLLIIAFSSAIYPKCTILYHDNYEKWVTYKKNINIMLVIIFLISGIFCLIFPAFIMTLFTGEKNNLSIVYLRAVAFVPLVISLNSLNLLELLIKNEYTAIFKISIWLLLISAMATFIILWTNLINYYAFYGLFIESICLLFYLSYLHRKTVKPTLTS